MDYLDVKTFFQNLATDNEWGFAHNSEHLEAVIATEKSWKNKLILTMDEPNGRLKRVNDQWQDTPSFGMWLHRPTDKGDWEKEDLYFDEAKKAYENVILVTITDQMEGDTEGIWEYFDGYQDYRKSGPMTMERLFGIYVEIKVMDLLSI
jgi:hypothetical protein